MGTLDQVKARVSARQAAERYGVDVNRAGKARCIWHSPDAHPSLSFKDGYCHCFTCGRGGSSIDVVMQLYGLSVADAAGKLNEDFSLGLSYSKPTAGAYRHSVQDKVLTDAFSKWVFHAVQTLTAYFRLLHWAEIHLAPATMGDSLHPLFAEAITEKQRAWDYLEILEHGNTNEQIRFFKTGKDVINEYDEKVRCWTAKGFNPGGKADVGTTGRSD